jgi:glutathione S-transferase
MKATLYHFPGCPYSERVEILLSLKGLDGAIDDVEIDLSQPRPDWLLQKTGGSTALPVLDCGTHVLRESTVILRYVDSQFPERRIRNPDPLKHAIESMLGLMDSEYAKAGYAMLRNRDQSRREDFRRAFDVQYEKLDSFLRRYGEGESFLFEDFGWAEIILAPLMKRLECLVYHEGYSIPDRLDRVRRWHSACLSHPAAQSRTLEEIVKLYYDYSRDVGGGALVPGRSKSSFTMDPHWSSRPWPPKDKWGPGASDSELGLA